MTSSFAQTRILVGSLELGYRVIPLKGWNFFVEQFFC